MNNRLLPDTYNYPELEMKGHEYFADGSTPKALKNPDDLITPLEEAAMHVALENAFEALLDGNPPVGAVLIEPSGMLHSAGTDDKTTKDILGHAELRAYTNARERVGDDLSDCTLVTTAQPCAVCSVTYAAGGIGKIVYAAPRDLIFGLTGVMRPRQNNLPEFLIDGNTDTTVIERYRAAASLALFAAYGLKRLHQPETRQPRIVHDLLSGEISGDSFVDRVNELILPNHLMDEAAESVDPDTQR